MTSRREQLTFEAWARQVTAKRLRWRRLRRRAMALGALCTLVLTAAALDPRPLLVWNVSQSAPIGLYAIGSRSEIDVGDMVLARVPEHSRRLAAMRHYIPQNVPLVKRAGAIAGDEVCARGTRVFVNGRLVAKRRVADALGRPMPWWNGCVRLRGRSLFLLMNNPASFDGRYFGPTAGTDVIGSARLLWAR